MKKVLYPRGQVEAGGNASLTKMIVLAHNIFDMLMACMYVIFRYIQNACTRCAGSRANIYSESHKSNRIHYFCYTNSPGIQD